MSFYNVGERETDVDRAERAVATSDGTHMTKSSSPHSISLSNDVDIVATDAWRHLVAVAVDPLLEPGQQEGGGAQGRQQVGADRAQYTGRIRTSEEDLRQRHVLSAQVLAGRGGLSPRRVARLTTCGSGGHEEVVNIDRGQPKAGRAAHLESLGELDPGLGCVLGV